VSIYVAISQKNNL